VRTRTSSRAQRVITAEERGRLQYLLSRIPVSADCHAASVTAFVSAWYRLHLPPYRHDYSTYLLRSTRSVSAEMLSALQAVLDEPDLSTAAPPNCDCDRCLRWMDSAM
jgi:hypothetical protein